MPEHPQQEERAVTSLQTRSAPPLKYFPQSPRAVATNLNTVRLDIVF